MTISATLSVAVARGTSRTWVEATSSTTITAVITSTATVILAIYIEALLEKSLELS